MYITPPYPECDEQLVNVVFDEEMFTEQLITDPFPSLRVMYWNAVFRVQVRERETCVYMSG